MSDKISESGSRNAAKENYLNSQVDLNSLGERMSKFAQKNGLPLDRPTSLKELMDKGFVMFNDTGEKERVIIQECNGQDWREKSLITADELALSKKETLPEGITDEQLIEIEEDMVHFIDEVQEATLLNEHVNQRGISRTMNRINLVAHEYDIFEKIREAGMTEGGKREKIIQEVQDEVGKEYNIPKTVRGIPVEKLARRGEKKANGHGCPVLDCPHVFSNTGGVLIYDGDGQFAGEPKTIRVNNVVAHLASHGISETGKAAVDQSYISIREYLPIFEKRTSTEIGMQKDESKIALKIFVESAKRILNESGVKTISQDELEKFGKEILFI